MTRLLSAKGKFLLAAFALAAALAAPLQAASLGASKLNFASFKEFNADSWQFVGQNIVAKGVYIPAGDLEIYADQATINIESRDIEAVGNVQVYRWENSGGVVDMAKLARIQNTPNCSVTLLGITGDVWGDLSVQVSISMLTDNIKAQRWSAIWTADTFSLRTPSSGSRPTSAGPSGANASRTASSPSKTPRSAPAIIWRTTTATIRSAVPRRSLRRIRPSSTAWRRSTPMSVITPSS